MEPRSINTGPYDADFDDPRFDDPHFGVTEEEKKWALGAHLSAFAAFLLPSFGQIIGPLIVWLVKRDQSAFVEDQAKEALNFQITMTIAFVVSAVLTVVLIGLPMMIAVGVAWLVFTIKAALRASEGEAYRYPFTIRFVK